MSNGGGLGLVGGGRGERDWLARELALVVHLTTKPWGVGFLTWAVDKATIAWTLDFRPAAVMLSFGDPAPVRGPGHDAGAELILQVTDLDEARRAVEVGADVVVAQGSDAGGDSGQGKDTEGSRVLDIARGASWPDRYPARTLRNQFLDTWRDREDELRGDAMAQQYREAAARNDLEVIPIWTGQAVGLITTVEPAGHLVAALTADAERALTRYCGD